MQKRASDQILSIRDLKFGYKKDRLIFDGFELDLNRGEIVAVVGKSGSGKSTLFGLIAGFLKPIAGEIYVARFSQVFQDPYSSFSPTYTIANQIADCAPLDESRALCEKLLIDPILLKRKPHELSGGQLQRLSILRALLMKPDLILADEPTSALDNISQLEVMKLFVGLLDSVGILLITHDNDLANWCADRVVRLGD